MSIAIGAAIAVMTGIGAGLGIGYATAKSSEAIARQPEASGQISKNLILGCALAEATAIFTPALEKRSRASLTPFFSCTR